jgi:hypothetical protein
MDQSRTHNFSFQEAVDQGSDALDPLAAKTGVGEDTARILFFSQPPAKAREEGVARRDTGCQLKERHPFQDGLLHVSW